MADAARATRHERATAIEPKSVETLRVCHRFTHASSFTRRQMAHPGACTCTPDGARHHCCRWCGSCRPVGADSVTLVTRSLQPRERMETIRAIVVDDERPARRRVLDLLGCSEEVEVVGECRDGWEAVELIRACTPQLMFLDIQMPNLNGFGVVESVEPQLLPAIVFITAYDTYAIQAFEAHALDYLVKPFGDERFETALRRVCRLIRSQTGRQADPRIVSLVAERGGASAEPGYLTRLVLKVNGRITFLDVDDVDWIEACGVYVHLHVGQRTHLYRSSVAQLLQRLDPSRFVRVHRSSVVNTSRIRSLQPRSHGDYQRDAAERHRARHEPLLSPTARKLAAAATVRAKGARDQGIKGFDGATRSAWSTSHPSSLDP
ncbi:MAG: response regulator [Luteitalea sp.]|nr:response regulator [Luteitalea sp.]